MIGWGAVHIGVGRWVVPAGAIAMMMGCGGGEPKADDTALMPARSAAIDSVVGPPTAGETSTLPQGAPDEAGVFRLAGNEPFWSVRITAKGLVYTTPDYKNGILFPSPPPPQAGAATGSSGATLRWVALTPAPEAHTLEVTLEEKRCQDSMADKVWTHVATIVFDGNTMRGCGERVAK